MSKISASKCDQCGRMVPDAAAVDGWVRTQEPTRLIVSTPDATTQDIGKQYREHRGSDWCSIGCLADALAGTGKKTP